jgi:hypothetical protein
MELELSCIIIQQYLSLWNYNCIQAVEKRCDLWNPTHHQSCYNISLVLDSEDKHIEEIMVVSMTCEIISGTYIIFLSTNMMQVDWLNSGIIYSKVTSELHLLIALDMLAVSIFIQHGYILLNSMWNYS